METGWEHMRAQDTPLCAYVPEDVQRELTSDLPV